MKKILVSFSGGRTSAYMSYLMKTEWVEHDLVFVFANTGQEHEKTLEFVDRCDREWGLGVVWVEAVICGEKTGTRHRVVNYREACRTGRLWLEMCTKYGLPNHSYPHCTRELKLQPIKSYMSQFGDYQTAIGIRADEYQRAKAGDDDIIYPLVDRLITKDDVMFFWEEQPFDLGLRDYQGNCTWCWKKSDKKLFKLMDDNHMALEVPKMLENTCATKGNGSDIKDRGWRQMFRGNRTTADLWRDRMLDYLDAKQMRFDFDLACGESCEIYSM